jgi:hypothetical protein
LCWEASPAHWTAPSTRPMLPHHKAALNHLPATASSICLAHQWSNWHCCCSRIPAAAMLVALVEVVIYPPLPLSAGTTGNTCGHCAHHTSLHHSAHVMGMPKHGLSGRRMNTAWRTLVRDNSIHLALKIPLPACMHAWPSAPASATESLVCSNGAA